MLERDGVLVFFGGFTFVAGVGLVILIFCFFYLVFGFFCGGIDIIIVLVDGLVKWGKEREEICGSKESGI